MNYEGEQNNCTSTIIDIVGTLSALNNTIFTMGETISAPNKSIFVVK